MAKARDPKTLQLLKAPSGDMMLVVPLDKATARRMQDKTLAVGVIEDPPQLPGRACPVFWGRGCPVIFGPFKFMKDYVIRPTAQRRVAKVVRRRVSVRK